MHIKPVNLNVDTAQCISLSGASGTGKSVLLRALIDLIPNSGEVSFANQRREQMRASDWRKLVGLLPAESFWWQQHIGDHFPEITQKHIDWFKQLGFEQQVLSWEVSRCSTGERQRLALLRLLCHGPKVLLLDEPTANLDQDSAMRVEKLIHEYQTLTQCPMIWVSHDQAQMKRVASEHYMLASNGQLQQVTE
ncbi:MAG: ATP-binding cassette domain-containing protein [Gammaproteobacteria bacterium]|nr:ATP-binding cassette domain-containing protein [Gammaproteobacteria bacterium]MDH5777354.1 ATP-binding cassette domain-containing protein [Gammaproteobacteria bacterium]